MNEMITQREQDNTLIKLELLRKDGEIKLFIKTCAEFEEYLKKNKKLIKSENFCMIDNKEKPIEFYENRLTTDTSLISLDSAINPLIYNGNINSAILRIKDISRGIELPLNAIIPIEEIENYFKKFITNFKKFYKEYLTDFSISVIILKKDL
jgi:hypothetical protein